MTERRKYVRIHEEAEITYSIIPFTKFSRYSTSNISRGGVRFFVYNFIPKGSHLKVKISFSRTNVTIEAMVKVIWIKEVPHDGEYEVGVKFMDISQESANRLANYIRSFVSTKPDADFDSL